MTAVLSPDRLKAPEQKPLIPKPVEEPRTLPPREAQIRAIIPETKAADPPANIDNIIAEMAERPQNVGLAVDLSEANLANLDRLRDAAIVGKDQYGDGIINTHHKGAKTVAEHEAAQAVAYGALQEKIDKGLVDPAAIGTEVCLKLGVKPELEGVPQAYEDIPAAVGREVSTFLEQGNLNQQEYEAIIRDVAEFAELYGKAYGKEDVAKAYEIVRDNARKLAYQSAVDKDVFSGSDHGTRHILDGNTRFAKQMIGSLREHGVVVSAVDEVIIHQVMIDHDLGYTTGAAQAPRGFEASKTIRL